MDKETAIVMCYTGRSLEMARAAIAQWQQGLPGWSAEYIRRYLSARDLEKLERLTDETQTG